jgi:hypothetical protein
MRDVAFEIVEDTFKKFTWMSFFKSWTGIFISSSMPFNASSRILLLR